MDQNIAPINTQSEYYLKALSGNFKGTVFRLSSKEIFIGRDASNHIAIPNDPKVSRKHARLILNKGIYYIQNISSKNVVLLNNESVKQSELRNNFIFTVGNHSFKFLSVNQNSGALQAPNNGTKKKAGGVKKPSLRAQKNADKNRFILYASVGVLFFLGIYMYLDDPGAKAKQKLRNVANTETILERADTLKKENERLKEERTKSYVSDENYQKAHSFYIKGFRDFQKGLYSIALSSFETCLSIYPEHILARRYSELSRNRIDELVALNLNQGKQNLDNGRYGFCISSFTNAMSEINDKTDPRYKEAKALAEKCQLLQGGRY